MPTMFKQISFGLLCCVLFSCKSIHRLATRDTSAQKQVATKKKHRSDLQFIDDISIAGGSASGQIDNPQANHNRKKKAAPQTVYAPPTDAASVHYNIEAAIGLQFKYAVLLDASVERLTNVSLLQNMDHWWGTHYCLGGSTENCIDCSAFTQIMMRDVYKTDIPRTARAQYDNSGRIGMDELQEGDLVFFETVGRDISHVGIYLTNNKFVHAATSGGVMISDLNDSYWRNRYKGSGRVLPPVQMFSSIQ